MTFKFTVDTEFMRAEYSEGYKARMGHSVESLLEGDCIPSNGKNEYGILYLLEFVINGRVVVKVGVTQRSSIEERTAQILVSFFKVYRFFPYVRPKRYKRCEDPYGLEAKIKSHFKDHKTKFKKSFNGSSECFDISLDDAVSLYDSLIEEQRNKGK